MKFARSPLFTALRLMTLVMACATLPAYADEYGDVGQLLRSGKFSDAMSKADAYLATKPNDPQMRFLKGVILRNTGKQAEAIATFTKLTEDYPELPEPYNNLAVLYAAQNQFEKARAALEMAIRTNPSYATAHENLGDVYARLASQAYNKALQLDSANSAVAPKLATIREVFKPNLNNPRPTTATTATAPEPAPATATPVASAQPAAVPTPAPGIQSSQAASNDKLASEVEDAVRSWAKAWAAQDMPAYLAAYGANFDPQGKQSRREWEAERRARIVGKSSISVTLTNVDVKVNGSVAEARFNQAYRAGSFAVSSKKTLDMVKVGDQWLIVKESTGNQ